MGMFDIVWVKCPKCNTENDFQSKSGECSLINVTLEECPDNILANVNRHAPIICQECGALYKVDTQSKTAVIVNN